MYRLLAILGIAFLLLNPAGICAGNGGVQKAPAHPCCPATPSSCVCIDRQPAPPVLPSLVHAGMLLAPAPAPLAYMADLALHAPAASDSAVFPSGSRFLELHQILV